MLSVALEEASKADPLASLRLQTASGLHILGLVGHILALLNHSMGMGMVAGPWMYLALEHYNPWKHVYGEPVDPAALAGWEAAPLVTQSVCQPQLEVVATWEVVQVLLSAKLLPLLPVVVLDLSPVH
jgi:hypothetical protein